ncbi:aminoglycoside phosphotransferase [[Actinomadura] parvosata subsp. kistnae]|uniref:Protein kinase domain-containing protein n=1 Tax=[Actinomadura] parvosata subsp. kistnae TaxID=1909395 RepID=A0A1V0AK37_9ACTN|nr:aminoglycoside phosphotransferase family protein [Nonomuraea sp. ATCC 55076]AQZ70594.1 hypothetical protein BKM31_23170 [Nonomuraea sp. ATCC 55076]SPL89842.1 aminoglycoside phosphotransferase [Actinomadura parvosata subsp. kistnae]
MAINAGYEPSDAALSAIARRHGVAAGRVRPLPPGVANHVFLLGDDLVLRVPRAAEFLPDLVKEAAVIPVALRAGVRTPEVVAFDDSCSEVDVPYMVLTRAPGADLARLGLSEGDAAGLCREVGRELGKLHGSASVPAGVPTEDDTGDPWELTGRLLAEGWIDAGTARRLTGWFDRLSPHLPASPSPVLVHGDVAPQNLLVSPGTTRLSGIVDWGDAARSDPAVDFAKMPLTCVPALLDGYRQEAHAPAPAWEARVLWLHLTWALGRLAAPQPRPGERHWTAPPASRILGLLHFFAAAPPAPWADLT